MYLLLLLLAQVTADVEWQPDQKTLQQYYVHCNKVRRVTIKVTTDEIKEIKARIREIRRTRIVPGTPGTIYDGVTRRLKSFASESGKTDALVRAQQELQAEENRIKDLRDKSKPYWAETEFNARGDISGTATPFVVGDIVFYNSIHKVKRVFEDSCLVEIEWYIPIGNEGEVNPQKSIVLVRHFPTEGLVDEGPIVFTGPLYVATTEQVLGKTYPVVVPVERPIEYSSQSLQPE